MTVPINQGDIFDLTNDNGRGIDTNADWGFAFTVATGPIVSVITSCRMEIRKTPSKSSTLIASFYSDGTGTGLLTIDDLTVTVSLPHSVSGADGFPSGRYHYDVYAGTDNGAERKFMRGAVDINPRVTQ